MNDNLPNLNGLASSQLKYNIVVSKFMTDIENYHKRNAPVSLLAVLKGLMALVVIIIASVWWALKKI